MQMNTTLRCLTVVTAAIFFCACFPQAYSPSLDLGYDQLRRGQVRLGGGLELAPHGESAEESTVGVLPAALVHTAVGLSANTEFHLKFQSNVFNGVGTVIGANIRVFHDSYEDVLVLPRVGVSSIAGYQPGYGGGVAVVWRGRIKEKRASWGGLGYYRGWYDGFVSGGFSGAAESGEFQGGAAVLHLGGSKKLNEGIQFNFELNPMVQWDQYHRNAAFVPAAKLGIAWNLNERRHLAAEKARKKVNLSGR